MSHGSRGRRGSSGGRRVGRAGGQAGAGERPCRGAPRASPPHARTRRPAACCNAVRRLAAHQAVVNDGDQAHNLRPAGLRQRLPRGDRRGGDVLELERREAQVRDVAGELEAGADNKHVRARKHGHAPVLDLHLLEAAVLLRVLRHQLQRVVHTKRLGRANVTRGDGAHLHRRDGPGHQGGLVGHRRGDDGQHDEKDNDCQRGERAGVRGAGGARAGLGLWGSRR